ncbi:hypothetical protein S245_019234 [Arachis hypogaea]
MIYDIWTLWMIMFDPFSAPNLMKILVLTPWKLMPMYIQMLGRWLLRMLAGSYLDLSSSITKILEERRELRELLKDVDTPTIFRWLITTKLLIILHFRHPLRPKEDQVVPQL